jgi:hypothetical protein
MTTASRSRALSLRAPIATEEERALFQRRLATTAQIVFILAFGFWVINIASVAILAPAHVVHVVLAQTAQVHLATSLAAGAIWLALTWGARGTRTLSALDSLVAVGLCAGWTLMMMADNGMDASNGERGEHRDIKPANIMLTERGGVPDVVKVLDFGLVKESLEAEKAAAADVTNATVILGTPHYMAPEAILDPKSVDGRADLYALGATAWLLLTGERVFDGSSLVEVCSKHLHEAPRSPSSKRVGIPAPLEAAVMACLAKKPEDRPRDASALAAALRDANVETWTRDQARGWWSEHAMTRSAKRTRSETSAPNGLERTVAVALDDRAAS